MTKNMTGKIAGKMAGTNPDSAGQCRTTISGHCAHVAGREHCREHCRTVYPLPGTVPDHHFGTLYPYSRPGTLPDSSVPPFRDTGGGWGPFGKKFFGGGKIMMSKMVQGSFWQKIIKSRGFRPNGHHEWFRSVKNSQNQPVRCQKGLMGTPFVTDRGREGKGGRGQPKAELLPVSLLAKAVWRNSRL